MTKAAKLLVEAAACAAVGRQFNCAPARQRVSFPGSDAKHEFDIYAQDIIIGGVSTSPLKVGASNFNTAGCDRASSELLWLSLWPGDEKRIHVLADKALAQWVIKRYSGIRFPHEITIYHYDGAADSLSQVGMLHD